MDPAPLLRRGALAAAGGFALYAAHPPIASGWLGLVAVAPLAALARDVARDARPLRSAFAWGTVAGAVFFLPLLSWLVNIRDAIAWPLLSLVQAGFVGLFLAGVVAWGDRRWRPLAVVVAWVAAEAVRSIAPLGGFGWGVLGYTQANGGPFLDVARSLGVLGVSAACAGVGSALEELVHRVRDRLRAGRGAGQGPAARGEAVFAAARAPLLAVVGIMVAGVLVAGEPPAPAGTTVDIAGVQGFDVEGSTGRALPRSIRMAEGMREVTAQALEHPAGRPDLTIWPENAIDGDPVAFPELGEIVTDAIDLLDGGALLTGAIEEGPRPGTHVNSLLLLEGDLTPLDRYVKRRLVPFGEYVPARAMLSWYPALDRVPSDGVAGTEPTVISAGGARVGSGICFDVVFPRFFHEQVRGGADVLVLATNNSSYGRTAMSDQHIAFSQLRAVESGRWLVHAALSGRSAIVDPTGAVHQRTGQYEQAIVRADIPLVEGITLATRLGDTVSYLAMGLAAVGLARVVLSRRDDVAEVLDRRAAIDQDRAWQRKEALEGRQPSG